MKWLDPPTPPLPRPAKLVGVDLLDAMLRPLGVFRILIVPGRAVELALQPRGVDDDGAEYPVERFALRIDDARELHRDLGAFLQDLDAEARTDQPAPPHRSTHL